MFERTGWRDSKLSLRHRQYGANTPMMDIDFLCVEYDRCQPSALIEYKNEHAPPQMASHPSYQTLIALGNRAELPVYAVRYADDFTWFRVIPQNQRALEFVPHRTEMTEAEYVKLLYKLRGHNAPQGVLDGLSVEI